MRRRVAKRGRHDVFVFEGMAVRVCCRGCLPSFNFSFPPFSSPFHSLVLISFLSSLCFTYLFFSIVLFSYLFFLALSFPFFLLIIFLSSSPSFPTFCTYPFSFPFLFPLLPYLFLFPFLFLSSLSCFLDREYN